MTEESKYLSEIELFYSSSIFLARNQITLEKTEYHHAVNVMRHHEGDNIYITNGEGVIFEGEITHIFEKHLLLNIIRRIEYTNEFGNVFFCFPILGQRDRFEFALEKSAELGITNFLIFKSKFGKAKGEKPERWEKILISAMKQSLRAFLPKIQFTGHLNKIADLPGIKILLDQHSDTKLIDYIIDKKQEIIKGNLNYYFIFGPEGDLAEEEKSLFADSIHCRLTSNRLRTETAVLSAANILAVVDYLSL